MSDERHISELISDNEKIYVELRSVVGQLKICVEALKEILELSKAEHNAGDARWKCAERALEKVEQKYK